MPSDAILAQSFLSPVILQIFTRPDRQDSERGVICPGQGDCLMQFFTLSAKQAHFRLSLLKVMIMFPYYKRKQCLGTPNINACQYFFKG
jgi:hypothetical protein